MKTAFVAALALLVSFAESNVYARSDKALPAIALVGGTLIDVSNSGRGTHDIPNAVVVLRGGKIETAGPAALVKIPRDANTLDYTGTYILPGLVDGFAGLNSQAQANAWLYMGVTTIVGFQDERRGILKLDARPSPHVYPLDLAGEIDDYSLLISLPQWKSKLKESADSAELSERETNVPAGTVSTTVPLQQTHQALERYSYQNQDVPRCGARPPALRPARNSVRAASAISWPPTPPAPNDWPRKLAYAFSSNAVSLDGDPVC